jgi:hypothetical protein
MEEGLLVIIWNSSSSKDRTVTRSDDLGSDIILPSILYMGVIYRSKLEQFIADNVNEGIGKNQIEIIRRKGSGRISFSICEENISVEFP